MAKRKYPRVRGKLYTRKETTASGYASWSMLEAEDGNHYRCVSPTYAHEFSKPVVEGILKIIKGKLVFIDDNNSFFNA